MKATARVVTGSVRATAGAYGGTPAAVAHAVGSGIAAKAESATPQPKATVGAIAAGLTITARATDELNILKVLEVVPVEPQQLVWLVPQVGVDYHITSNTKWNIK